MKKKNAKRGSLRRRVSRAPADCSEDQLCRIGRDNISVGDFSILTDSYRVWLSEQKIGESPKQGIEIPPAVFKKLAQWYFRPQRMKRG